MSDTSSVEEIVFDKDYEPSILAILSGQIVSFPETQEPINGTSKINIHSTQWISNSIKKISFFYNHSGEPYYVGDHIAQNCQAMLSPAKKSGKLRFAKHVEIPLGADVIASLPQFCLPGEVHFVLKPLYTNLLPLNSKVI